MKHPLCLLLLTVFLAGGNAAAQGIGGEDLTPLVQQEFDEILLKDGTLLRGTILEERDDAVVFETASLGRLEITRDRIERIARAKDPAGVITDPDQNSIMFCPTPATLPRGTAYFRDFELFVLNFGFGVTDALDLSLGTLFPFSGDVLMLSGGAKLRLLDRESSPLGLALTGSYTKLEETHFGAFGAVAGVGDAQRSLNLAVNLAYDDDGDTEAIFIVGGDWQGGRHTKIFAEFFSSSTLLQDEDDDLEGFINIGLRLFGEAHSFSLSGFRPLTASSGSFIAFPMIMFSQRL